MQVENDVVEMRVVTIKLDDAEVKQFCNFLSNAKALRRTSSYDEPLITQMIKALEVL